MPETCRYQFDPEAWSEKNQTQSSLAGVWNCPHETHPGKDYCVFHMPFEERERIGVTDVDVRDEFVGAVSDEEEPNEFIGAIFGTLDLSEYEMEPPYGNEVDVRHSTIDGKFNLSDSTIMTSFKLDHSDVQKIEAQNVVFEGDVSMSDVHCSDVVDFDGAFFGGDTIFGLSRFELDAGFPDVEFKGETDFRGAVFKGVNANFRGAIFDGRADFRRSRYRADFDITRARFGGEANFSNALFSEKVECQYTVFGGWTGFTNIDIKQNATFRGAKFDDYLEFEDSMISGWITFQKGEFGENASFEDTKFNKSIKVMPEKTVEGCIIDFRGATLRGGTLAQPDEGSVFYDFTEATVGNIEITKNEGQNVFNFLQFYETKYDGFDFSNYQKDLSKKKRVIHDSELGGSDFTPEGLETTYHNAKQAAQNRKDRKNAPAFKTKCMRYRRKKHMKKVSQDDSILTKIVSLFNWIGNLIYDITLGFGTKPHRLLLIIIIVGAAVAFALGIPQEMNVNLEGLF